MPSLVTATAYELTDATRALAVDGDGRAAETSYGVWPASRNLHPNGGFETDTDLWAAFGGGASIARVATTPKFGAWCLEVVNGCQSASIAALVVDRHGALSFWLDAPAGATFDVTVLDGVTPVSTLTGYDPPLGWHHVVLRFVALNPTTAYSFTITRVGGGTFRLDGVQLQQNPTTEIVPEGETPLTGSIVTPYAHTDRGAVIWPGQPNLHPNGSFETNTDGWTAFGAGATLSRVTSWTHEGTTSLECVTTTAANIGVRSEAIFALEASKLYAVSFWIDAPASESFKVEVTDGGIRAAIDFTYTPGSGPQRKILTFTSRATPGNCGVFISKNSANAITFRVDDVQITQQPATLDPPNIPDGYRAAGAITVPASGIMNPSQMWFALRVRLGWGTDEPGGGSPRFFRWSDGDTARVEAFYAISTDAWGVRRQNVSQQISAQIPAASIPAVAGDIYTVIGQWTPTQTMISVNGSAFDAYGQSTEDGANVPTITAPTFEIAAGGSDGAAGMDVLWFACGRGTLTNAGAAAIHAVGDPDPLLSALPLGSGPRFIWRAATATAWFRRPRRLAPAVGARAA